MTTTQTHFQLAAFTTNIVSASIDLPNVLSKATGGLLSLLFVPLYPVAWLIIWQIDLKIRQTFKASFDIPQSDEDYIVLRSLLTKTDNLLSTFKNLETKTDDEVPALARKVLSWKPIFIREKQAILSALHALDNKAVKGDNILDHISESEAWDTRSKGYQYRF